MNWNAAFTRIVAARRMLVCGLLLASVGGGLASCGDSDSTLPLPSGHAGASTAGGGGPPNIQAGETGVGGEGVAGTGGDSAAGNGGDSTMSTGGDAGAPTGPRYCLNDRDCDDGLYCNGVERCRPLQPSSDIKVCMGPEFGPCGPSACTETTKCNCDDPDQDQDHFNVEGCTKTGQWDCDDTDSDRSPAKLEVCDDQLKDEDCNDATYGDDADHDGFIDTHCASKLRYQPLFYTPKEPLTVRGTDCNDGDPAIHPGAVEVCDNVDNDCNGKTDEVSEGNKDPHIYYRDLDGDTHGDVGEPRYTLCNSPPPGYVSNSDDCDDKNYWVNLDREETCDGIDDDCDGTTDQPDKPGNLMSGEPYDGVTDFVCTEIGPQKIGWKVKHCPPGRLDCNVKYQDACETIGTTLCNCHACGKTCAFSCGDTDCGEIALLSAGNLHTCAVVQPGGSVACWGRNVYGQLGNGTTRDSTRATKIPDLANVEQITSGALHSCAIDSGGRLVCWGSNKPGQLGAGVPDSFLPYPVEVYQSAPALKARQVSSGSYHTCAILEQGRLICWGEGKFGKLGNNHTDNAIAPVRVVRLVNGAPEYVNDATQVVAGEQHSCSLSNGRVECWGDNSSQQLGVDPAALNSSARALPVPGLDGVVVNELSASSYHTCALAGAEVYCWGSNLDNELALESVEFGPPTKIPLPEPAISITTGSAFGCALGSTGTAYCWGSNYQGERGALDNQPAVLPNQIPLPRVTGIFAGRGEHVCAKTNNAQVYCWGNNNLGQLGIGQTSSLPHPTPTAVLTLGGSQACLSQ